MKSEIKISDKSKITNQKSKLWNRCHGAMICTTASIFLPLTFYFIIFLLLGCEESAQFGFEPIDGRNQVTIKAQAWQIIGLGLTDQNPQVRTNAIEVVAKTKSLNMMQMVQPMLKDENIPVRFAAAVAIGDLRFLPAREAINTLLKDQDVNVILAASYAMTKFGYPYIEALQISLNNDNDVIRANAIMLLGKAGDKSSISRLQEIMQDKETKDFVAYQAAETLATLGDQTIYPKLWAMLISEFADVRIAGIRAMSGLGTKQAQEAITTLLDDQVPEVRIVAAEELGKLGNKSGERVVIEVFKKRLISEMDPQSAERVNVLSALAIGRIGTKAVTGYLPQLMKNQSILVKLAAAQAVLQSIP
jgi:HEAT repeat protein